MTQSSIVRGITSAAVEVVNPGNIKAYPREPWKHQGTPRVTPRDTNPLASGDVFVGPNVLAWGDLERCLRSAPRLV